MGYIAPHLRVLNAQTITEEVKKPFVPIHLRLAGISPPTKTTSSSIARPKTPPSKLSATAASFTPSPPCSTASPPHPPASPPHPTVAAKSAPKFDLSIKPACAGLASSMWANSDGTKPAPQKKRVDSLVSRTPTPLKTIPAHKRGCINIDELVMPSPTSPTMPSIFGKPETPAAQPERELIVKTKPATLQPSPVLNQSITAGVTGSFAVPSWDFSAIKVTKPTSDGSSVVTAFSNMSPMSQTLTKSLEHTPVTILSKPSPPTSVQKLEEPIERPQPPIATPSINGQQNAQSTKDAYSDAFNKYQYHSNATPVHTASKPPQITYKPQRPKTEKQLGGWLTKEERKAMAKRASDIGSDDNVASYDDGGFGTQADIDWNAPNQLVDWEGNILPAPVEWSSRHQCQRDNWASVMVEYIEKSQPHYVKQGDKAVSALIIDTSSKSFCSGAKGVENGEVAPKEWIANNIENQTLQSFWKSLMQTVLSPVDESDLQGAPFWQRYNDNTTILQPLKHEEAKCEPVEDDVSREYFLYKTGQTQTAELAIKKHNEKVNAKEREEINNRRMIKERCTAEKARFQEPPPPNPLRPAANFYLRPLSVSRDSAALHEIYTHYAANTFQAVDNAAVDLAAFCSELQALRATALPMIVAVERAPGAKHKSRFEATTRAPEKIIGYATTDQGSTSRKQMSHLGHMEIYVHPEYAHKGVGKNLLDRMLWLLDPTYRIQGDVSWKTPSNELSYTMPGGKRSVVAVRVAMFYGEGEKAKADWVGTWLEKFAFEKQADFSRAGMKMGQWTRQTVWQRECNADLDPKTIVRA